MLKLSMGLVLLLSLSLTGCGPQANLGPEIVYSPCAPLVVEPMPGANEGEQESLSTAIRMWGAVGINAFTREPTPDAPKIPVLFKDGPSLFHGIYEPSLGQVTINRQMVAQPRDITVAHELGHAIGLPHIDPKVRLSVMNPDNHTVLPTAEDEGALHALWSCPAVP